MNFDEANNWISYTAIAVAVQEELEAFRSGRWTTGLQLAALNRLKIITAIACHAFIQLASVINTAYMLLTRQISIALYLKMNSIVAIDNIAHIIFGLIALPLTEVLLQEYALRYLCQLADFSAPYHRASRKLPQQKQFEMLIWTLAEETRDELVINKKITVDDLQTGDGDCLRLLFRPTVLHLIERLEYQTEDGQYVIFATKNDPTSTFSLYKESLVKDDMRLMEVGLDLKMALKIYQKLNSDQKELLDQLFIQAKPLDAITHSVSTDAQEEVLALFREMGTLETLFTKFLLNSDSDIEQEEKTKKLFMR